MSTSQYLLVKKAVCHAWRSIPVVRDGARSDLAARVMANEARREQERSLRRQAGRKQQCCLNHIATEGASQA